MDTQRIFSSGGKPSESNAPASVAAPARSEGGSGVNIDAALGVATVLLLSLLFLEILMRFVVPGFQEPRRYGPMDAKELERTWQQMVETKAAQEKIQTSVNSEHIGQANFPHGDSIEITS